MRRSIAIPALVVAAGAVLAGASRPVAFPENYRDWTHVKSMVIKEGHPLFEAFGGIHHLYANDMAIRGYRTGEFPDGAVIVFDLLEAVDDGQAVTEGGRKVLGVMEKDRARFGDTGGWGFEGFGGGDPDKRVVGANAKQACFACHAAKADSDFVFSTWRD
ncbi:MAG TPA: cytochrome P460 family protein [Gammaproteobacteria bacterium]